ESTSLRYTPEVGAQCISSACWDLCGGCRVTGIPTATMVEHATNALLGEFRGIFEGESFGPVYFQQKN
ncbi:MAG: hypothetical protein JRJ86_18445, partial [Deltaproteobacteria bacterium]|nr:hypothetical protein [Deltaproteobacteria bacterium]